MSKLSADELRAKVTNRLIEALENGTRPWIKPWIGDPNAGFPTNIVSKNRYRGVNPWMLNLTSMDKDFSSKWWGTYKQWQSLDGNVRKGEKSTMIVFWKTLSRYVTNESTGESERKMTFFLRYSNVFNFDQVDNAGEELPEGKAHKLDKYRINKDEIPTFEHEVFEPAESVINDSGASIEYKGGRAFYSLSTDSITCPLKEKFPKLQDFYSTMFHELAHWCEKRTGFKEVEDKSYALGELVAEIGSCYVCEHIGVPVDNPDENDEHHAAYLKSWLGALKDDPKFIFTASKWASKAADMLLDDEVKYDDDKTVEKEVAESFHA
jgi:antirestriction protein ArdC